ncbi:MAG: hypothetical protein AAGI63_18320 [Planctomycetota bacterium]
MACLCCGIGFRGRWFVGADRSVLFAPLLAVLVLAAAGCSSSGPDTYQTNTGYDTVTPQATRAAREAQRLNQQAIEQIQRENWEEAEALLKRALASDVMYGPAHNNLGRVYYAKGQLYLAAWEFQYAIRLMPHHVEPRNTPR